MQRRWPLLLLLVALALLGWSFANSAIGIYFLLAIVAFAALAQLPAMRKRPWIAQLGFGVLTVAAIWFFARR